MLTTRIYTAFVLLGVLGPVFIWAPMGVLNGFIALIAAIAAWEWSGLLKVKNLFRFFYSSIVFFGFFLCINCRPIFFTILLYFSGCFWLFFVPFSLRVGTLFRSQSKRVFLLISGVIILCVFSYSVFFIHRLSQKLFLSLLLIVWLGDTGAFFAGRFIGGIKLAPKISPQKTWSGFFGGYFLVVCSLLFFLFWSVSSPFVDEIETITHFDFSKRVDLLKIFTIVSFFFVLSVGGDLFESLMKRQAGVKDSGYLLPGHGGLLDRIDSLLPIFSLVMILLL